MEENIGYLQRIELLAALVVSTLQQLLVELGASYYPSHQMGSCHVRVGLRQIEQGYLLLGVTSYIHFLYNGEFSHTDLTDLTEFRLLRSFSIKTK